ncbi:hypothetical protein JCM10450v2_007643 [Rhodotorula kratochvilovae]
MLRPTLSLARAVPRRAFVQARGLASVSPLYTTTAVSKGSRAAGSAKTQSGLEIKMDLPKEFGGKGAKHNPEELFGAAVLRHLLPLGARPTHGNLHKGAKPLPKSTQVDAVVTIGKDAEEKVPGFLLAVELKVHAAPLKEIGLDDAQIQKLVEEAHKMCPYSRAVDGNVAVKLSVV